MCPRRLDRGQRRPGAYFLCPHIIGRPMSLTRQDAAGGPEHPLYPPRGLFFRPFIPRAVALKLKHRFHLANQNKQTRIIPQFCFSCGRGSSRIQFNLAVSESHFVLAFNEYKNGVNVSGSTKTPSPTNKGYLPRSLPSAVKSTTRTR